MGIVDEYSCGIVLQNYESIEASLGPTIKRPSGPCELCKNMECRLLAAQEENVSLLEECNSLREEILKHSNQNDEDKLSCQSLAHRETSTSGLHSSCSVFKKNHHGCEDKENMGLAVSQELLRELSRTKEELEELKHAKKESDDSLQQGLQRELL